MQLWKGFHEEVKLLNPKSYWIDTRNSDVIGYIHCMGCFDWI